MYVLHEVWSCEIYAWHTVKICKKYITGAIIYSLVDILYLYVFT